MTVYAQVAGVPLVTFDGPSGQGRSFVKADRLSGAVVMIDYSHHEIHDGNHYKAGFMDVTMDTNDVIDLLFVTPDTATHAHWALTAQSTGVATVELYEGTTATGGTAVTIWNRDRNSAKTAGVTVFHTPTVTDAGTKMSTRWIGGTGFRTDVSGEHRGDSEFILKQNTKYLVRATANTDSIKVAIGGDWYEHEATTD
jgi:hypothetical protein